MKVGVIGSGYVGLVSGVCLASKGHHVTCYDNNNNVVDSLNNGIPTIHETGLQQLLISVIKDQRFIAKLISDGSQFHNELIIIAVGTPTENGKIDLSYVKQVSESIGKYLKSNNKQLMYFNNIETKYGQNLDYNETDYTFTDLYLGMHYRIKSGKFTISPGFTAHAYNSKNTQFGTEYSDSFFKLLPDFNVIIQLKNSESIRFNYAMRTQFTDVTKLARGLVLNNYNSIFSFGPC